MNGICSLLGIIVLFAVFPLVVHADVVIFTGSRADVEAGLVTTVAPNVPGIDLTISANIGTLNSNSNRFGINAPNADTAAELDSEDGAEAVTISFACPANVQAVVLDEIDISSFGTGEMGTLTIGANSQAIAAGTNTSIPAHTNLCGSSMVVAHTGGATLNGFSLDSITYTVTAVPEPSSIFLVGLLGVFVAGHRWHLRKKTAR